MPPKSKSGDSSLGRAIIRKSNRDRERRRHESAGTGFGVADIKSSTNALRSVTQVSSLEDFVANAVLSDRQFVAERAVNMTLVGADGRPHGTLAAADDGAVRPLRIPRRPLWSPDTTKEELESNETRSFLEWRASIAKLEDSEKSLTVTPFEKNLEVWKQLWRVVERSDLLIQIVDARNPTLFRCPDLEEYVREVNPKKQLLILVNKSDFLSLEFRLAWGKYFESQQVQFLFFSAKLEQEKIDSLEREMNTAYGPDGVTPLEAALASGGAPAGRLSAEDSVSDEEGTVTEREVVSEEEKDVVVDGDTISSEDGDVMPPADDDFVHRCRIVGRDEFIELLLAKQRELVPLIDEEGEEEEGEGEEGMVSLRPLVVGMVGYPNVGKSSTINALLGASTMAHGAKRVSVGCTPGKTKHFQTLALSPQVTLCDCPGLVFPSFVTSSAEMVINGVLPIAHLRDHAGLKPLQSSSLLYSPPGAFLDVFCHGRGFMASYHAGYDHPRGARHVLMDYMQGKLLYCFPPPTAPDMNIYAPIINAYYDAMEKVGLASVREEEEEEEEGRLPHDLHSVSTRHHAAAANVLDVPDTSALFTIPVPKPKSAKASVAMSRHKPRKGRRDPDPYGTHAAADPVSVMVLEELQALALEAKVDGGEGGKARKHGPGITPEALLGKGKGRANASTFTRVQRPYSAK